MDRMRKGEEWKDRKRGKKIMENTEGEIERKEGRKEKEKEKEKRAHTTSKILGITSSAGIPAYPSSRSLTAGDTAVMGGSYHPTDLSLEPMGRLGAGPGPGLEPEL